MLLDASQSDLNSSTKRPRTLSTPTSDHGDKPPRIFGQNSNMSAACSPQDNTKRKRPSPGVQFHEIQQSMPKGGDVAAASGVPHYLVPASWWSLFIKYVKEFDKEPPELNLDELDTFKVGGELRDDLRNGIDIQILQVETWTKIQEWYGQEDEQCVRHSYKRQNGEYVVELRPTDLYFSLYTPPNQFSDLKCIAMYRYKDVDGLYEKVRYAFGIEPSDQIRFWHSTKSQGLTNLSSAKAFIQTTHERVSIGHVIDTSTSFIVETRSNGIEKWPLELTKSAQIARGRPSGTKGLSNLGNTCYMASALQCLCHVKELVEFFISGCYKTELNIDNPLGYSGRVANSFAKLLEQLYAEDAQKSVAPRELKMILGQINSSFGGYQQQDSQELLAFLLDALHEDLNRIVSKPATQRPDIGKVSDSELLHLGLEAWRIHKLRNDSVVVDLFQGMYKSTLVCPICAHVSVTFDPFSDLSLPLPFRSYWSHEIHFVPLKGGMRKISLEFEQNASIGHVIAYLAKRYSLPVTHIAGAEVWKNKFYKIYENYMPVTTIEKSDDAFFYELCAADPRIDKLSKNIWVPIYHYKKNDRRLKPDECALPFVILFSQEELSDYDAIQQKILQAYSRFTTSDDLFATRSPIDLHPEQTYDSDLDTDDLRANDKPPRDIESKLPFEIKVAAAKTNSFYDRSEPVLLTQRRQPKALRELSDTLYDNPLTVASQDDLPTLLPILPEDIAEPDVHDIDVGMKDDSDEDSLQARPGSNSDLVARFLENPADSILTPESVPGSPVRPASEPIEDENNTDSIALLRDGDALHCEWPESAYDAIFSSDSSALAGESLWSTFAVDIDEELQARREAREESKDSIKSLDDCLDEFAKEEPLDAENTWYCPTCKEHQRANKTFELWRTGDVLVFHLKRFSNSRSLSDKIDAEIQFPIRGLDLTKRLGERKLVEADGKTLEDDIYDLTGIVNHYGGLGGGHYTAFAQTFDTDGYQDFHNFNDSTVNPMEASSLVSSSAYLLFYRRRTVRPLGDDINAKISNYNEEQNRLKDSRLKHEETLVDSVPLMLSPPPDSPATSSSGEHSKEPYVPFFGTGRQLGGSGDNYVRTSSPASNPFHTASWTANGVSRFVTTSNSETSDRQSVPRDLERALSPFNNDDQDEEESESDL